MIWPKMYSPFAQAHKDNDQDDESEDGNKDHDDYTRKETAVHRFFTCDNILKS